jgi:hypothetical protein
MEDRVEREAVSEEAWWETRGDVGGDSVSGDKGTRKSVGGGVADETFGVKIDKQSVQDGVVTTISKISESHTQTNQNQTWSTTYRYHSLREFPLLYL